MTKTVSAYHDLLAQAVAGLVGREVTQEEIRAAYAAAHPDRPGDLQWVMAADHCANHTNRGACGCAMTERAVFDGLGRNRYRVRELDAAGPGPGPVQTPSTDEASPPSEVTSLQPGQRLWHQDNGWGKLLEINLRSTGKTRRPTALVEWEHHRVEDWKHGEACSWVSLSSLSALGPSYGPSGFPVGPDSAPVPAPTGVARKSVVEPSSTPAAQTQPAPNAGPPVATRTERLQWIKLALEIGVVTVTLIGATIALIWRSK